MIAQPFSFDVIPGREANTESRDPRRSATSAGAAMGGACGIRVLRSALRGAVFDRSQRLGVATPAAVFGFLKRERLFDREAIADREVFPAGGRRWLWLPRLQIP